MASSRVHFSTSSVSQDAKQNHRQDNQNGWKQSSKRMIHGTPVRPMGSARTGTMDGRHHIMVRQLPHSWRRGRVELDIYLARHIEAIRRRQEREILIRADIVPVTNAGALRQFIRLPWKIYREDPFWVPPLIVDMKKLLDKSKASLFRSLLGGFLSRRAAMAKWSAALRPS